jgi:hypothetical protein
MDQRYPFIRPGPGDNPSIYAPFLDRLEEVYPMAESQRPWIFFLKKP